MRGSRWLCRMDGGLGESGLDLSECFGCGW